jgi:ketosteroid isomerase-like protein
VAPIAAQIEDIRDLGESVLVLGRVAVSGRATQIELETELGELITFRDGTIATVHDYLSHREGLEAAGLQE